MGTTYYYTEPKLVATDDPSNPFVGAAADAFLSALGTELENTSKGIKTIYFLYSVAAGAATSKEYDLFFLDGKVKIGEVWFDSFATNAISFAIVEALGLVGAPAIAISIGVSLTYSVVQNYGPEIYNEISGTVPLELKLLDTQGQNIGGVMYSEGLGGETKPLIAYAIYDMLSHREAASAATTSGMKIHIYEGNRLLTQYQILSGAIIHELSKYFSRSTSDLFGNDVGDPLYWTDGQYDGYQIFFEDSDNPLIFATPKDKLSITLDILRPSHKFFINDMFFGKEILNGNSRNNLILGADGERNVLSGGAGNDLLLARELNDSLNGGVGNDELYAGSGNDTLDGGTGIDRLYGQGGDDVLLAAPRVSGADQDRYDGGDGIDTLDLRQSLSAVAVSLGASGAHPAMLSSTMVAVSAQGAPIGVRSIVRNIESIVATTFSDQIVGVRGSDKIYGNSGNDAIYASLGSDIIDGGSGWDTLSYSTLALNIDITTIDASLGNYRVRKYDSGSVGTDRLFSIENLIGKKKPVFEQAGGEVISGTSLDDGLGPHSRTGSIASPFTFRGLGGNDTLFGSEANDRFIGGRGDDFMQGGRGNDIFEYNKGDGNDRIQVNGSGNDGHQSDQLVFGTGIAPGDVTLTRDASEDVKITIAGSGTILLEGQLSFPLDFIRFANGTIWDMETMRVPVYGTESESGDVINGVQEMLNAREGALVSELIYGLGGDDSINAGSGENVVYGGAGNDWISGGIDRDILSGDAGNDFLAGNDQDDRLSGGDGDDELRGENGADTLLGQGGADDLTGGDGTDMLSGGAANDVLAGGLGNDTISGDAGNDRLTGDSGDDTLNGGSGNDTLDGGTGNDVLNGGTGRDRFEFTTNPGNDTIVGFEKAFDIINPQFSASFNEFTEMKISQKGADTIIDLGIYDLTLANYLAINLTESNFSFV